MASSKFESLWKLMSAHDFNVPEFISNELLCDICKKLLIEPYSSICGCHFCGQCIREYQKDGNKFCPGIHDECKIVLLEIGKNVLMDFTTQFQVTRIVTKCPYDKCSECVSLGNMEEHMRFCAMRPMSCPYQCLGCENSEDIGCTVVEHLQSDMFSHCKLMIEAFNNFRNDFNIFINLTKKENDVRKSEIDDLKLNDEFKNGLIKKLEEIISNYEREKVSKDEFNNLKEENRKYKVEIDIVKNELGILKNTFSDLQKKVSSMDTGKKCNVINSFEMSLDFQELKKEINILKENMSKYAELEIFNNHIKKYDNDINTLNNENKKYNNEIRRIDGLYKNLSLNFKYDFLWTITSFLKKKLPVSSDNFFKDYYKFSLNLLSEGNSYRFEIRLMKNELSDLLDWPMKLKCSFGIVNQETLTLHKTYKCSYATVTGDKAVFNKPVEEYNSSFGGFSISHKDLKNTSGLLVNESVIICCNISSH